MTHAQLDQTSPLVIGGTGGSGTRAVKRIVDVTGRFMGSRLNASDDALDLARFDWDWGLRGLEFGASDEMRAAFQTALDDHLEPAPALTTSWGWKHPHSYLLLEFLDAWFAGLRFVHVVRDGCDMALSENQNQLRHYGGLLLEDAGADAPAPVRSLSFWAEANLRAAEYGERRLGERYLRVRFEDLCAEPATEARRLMAFTGGQVDETSVSAAVAEVRPPETVGRGAGVCDPAELPTVARKALEAFGYLEPR